MKSVNAVSALTRPQLRHGPVYPATVAAPNQPLARYGGVMAQRVRKPGARIGEYVVVDVLGRGGSGDVYKVVDSRGATAALKLVDTTKDAAARERLRREVAALRSLNHPAVPHVLDSSLTGSETFVVFDFVDGVSLAQQIAEKGPLKGKKLADLAETLASALAASHKAGVIHRDVTPANVMMGRKGPMLIDFGLSHREEDPRLTREGLVSGTAGYVAPEVIDGAKPGAQADLWSWAATVAYAMTGEAPFGLGKGALGRTFAGEVTLPEVDGAEAIAASLSLDIKARPSPADVCAALRGATVRLTTGKQPASRPGHPLSEKLNVTRVYDLGDVDASESASASSGITLPPVRVKRTGTILMWTVTLAAAAALAPSLSFLVLLVLAVVGRVEHRRLAALFSMRARRGQRRGDAVLATMGLPWHTLRASGEVLPAAAIGLAVGGTWAALAWTLVSKGMVLGESPTGLAWGHALALATGTGLAALFIWRGPWSAGTRDGVRRLAVIVAPSRASARGWVIVALMVVAIVVFGLLWRTEPWWWPLPELPGPAVASVP